MPVMQVYDRDAGQLPRRPDPGRRQHRGQGRHHAPDRQGDQGAGRQGVRHGQDERPAERRGQRPTSHVASISIPMQGNGTDTTSTQALAALRGGIVQSTVELGAGRPARLRDRQRRLAPRPPTSGSGSDRPRRDAGQPPQDRTLAGAGKGGRRPRTRRGPEHPREAPSWLAVAPPARTLTETERDARRQADRDRLQQAAGELLTSDGWQRWVRVRATYGLARYQAQKTASATMTVSTPVRRSTRASRCSRKLPDEDVDEVEEQLERAAVALSVGRARDGNPHRRDPMPGSPRYRRESDPLVAGPRAPRDAACPPQQRSLALRGEAVA